MSDDKYEIKRDETKDSYKYYNYILDQPFIINGNIIKSKFKNILIMDDVKFKTILLNERTKTNSNEKLLSSILENSICIFDEYDSLINPLSSDFNYPLNEPQNLSESSILTKSDVLFLIKFISFIILKKDTESKKVYIVSELNGYFEEYKSNDTSLVINEKKKVELFRVISQLSNLIYLKDYGLPLKDEKGEYSHKDIFINLNTL